MSRKKSQLNLNLDERTKTPKSIPINLEPPTHSSARTKTRETFKSAFFNFMRDFKKKGHKNKPYKNVMLLGARRWRGMTQADRVPYILEAARNRRVNLVDNSKSKAPKKIKNKKRKVTNKKASRTIARRRCPACGRRKKSECRSSTGTISRSGSSNIGTSSSKSYKSSESYISSKSSN